jgi:hypothetical protein
MINWIFDIIENLYYRECVMADWKDCEIFLDNLKRYHIPVKYMDGDEYRLGRIRVPIWSFKKAKMINEYSNLELNYIQKCDELQKLKDTMISRTLRLSVQTPLVKSDGK